MSTMSQLKYNNHTSMEMFLVMNYINIEDEILIQPNELHKI